MALGTLPIPPPPFVGGALEDGNNPKMSLAADPEEPISVTSTRKERSPPNKMRSCRRSNSSIRSSAAAEYPPTRNKTMETATTKRKKHPQLTRNGTAPTTPEEKKRVVRSMSCVDRLESRRGHLKKHHSISKLEQVKATKEEQEEGKVTSPKPDHGRRGTMKRQKSCPGLTKKLPELLPMSEQRPRVRRQRSCPGLTLHLDQVPTLPKRSLSPQHLTAIGAKAQAESTAEEPAPKPSRRSKRSGDAKEKISGPKIDRRSRGMAKQHSCPRHFLHKQMMEETKRQNDDVQTEGQPSKPAVESRSRGVSKQKSCPSLQKQASSKRKKKVGQTPKKQRPKKHVTFQEKHNIHHNYEDRAQDPKQKWYPADDLKMLLAHEVNISSRSVNTGNTKHVGTFCCLRGLEYTVAGLKRADVVKPYIAKMLDAQDRLRNHLEDSTHDESSASNQELERARTESKAQAMHLFSKELTKKDRQVAYALGLEDASDVKLILEEDQKRAGSEVAAEVKKATWLQRLAVLKA